MRKIYWRVSSHLYLSQSFCFLQPGRYTIYTMLMYNVYLTMLQIALFIIAGMHSDLDCWPSFTSAPVTRTRYLSVCLPKLMTYTNTSWRRTQARYKTQKLTQNSHNTSEASAHRRSSIFLSPTELPAAELGNTYTCTYRPLFTPLSHYTQQ